MEIEDDTTKGSGNKTSLTIADTTLLQTLQDHMMQCITTPYSLITPTNKSSFGVLCYENDICLGEVLLNSPVLVIDGSEDDSIMSRIGFGNFPNSNSTKCYMEHRKHIGLVMYDYMMMSEN